MAVRRAALGVYVLSACYLLLAAFATLSRDAAIIAEQERTTTYTDAEIAAAVNALVIITVVVGLGIATVATVAAIHFTRGRRWARVTATVVVGIALLFSLLGLLGSGGIVLAVHTVVIVSGSAALVLLYRRAASEYFARPRVP